MYAGEGVSAGRENDLLRRGFDPLDRFSIFS